jgi:hypothetical protein
MMQNHVGGFKKLNWILIVIVALGGGLRLWGIGFGLPYLYHPDEGVPVRIALQILHTGDFNPHFFHWSSLLFYANAFVYGMYFIFGRLTGRFVSPSDLPSPDIVSIAVGKTAMPEEFLLSRGLTAVVGTLSIIGVYLICRRMSGNRAAGWIAALFLAVEPLNVLHSHYIRPDTFVVFFVLVTVYYSFKIVSDPRLENYILAGICAGLATSFKYNAALVCIPILVAHLIHFGVRGLSRKEIYWAASISLVVFLLTTPYAVLDWQHFLQMGPLDAARIYATGHTGAEGDTLQWYINFLSGILGWMLLLVLGEIFAILFKREKQGWVLLSFPLAYFLLINFYTVHFDETALPVMPFLLILSAQMIVRICRQAVQLSSAQRRLAWLAAGVGTLVLASPLLVASATNDMRLLEPDGREQARIWIDANLPPASRIAVEPYSPYVDTQRYMVAGVDDMTSHSPDWFVQNGFEYLVFSYGSYGRFFENRARYREVAARYDEFFARFSEIQQFNDGGYEIRIYRTDVTDLPSHRVAARFGIYGNWLELVGYDVRLAQAGKPLDVVLHWRALEARREPLQLTARLRDAADREIAQSSGALFGSADSGGRWREGITRVPWTMAAPAEPGLYRLELDVDVEGQGRVPVLSRASEPISDKIFIGPFKVSSAPPSPEELQRARPANIRFGDAIVLQSYSLSERARRPGDVVNLTLYWQSAAKIDKDYTVFVHLLDASGKVRAQMDAPPRGGAYPTSLWDAGEIVRDDYALALPRDLAPGDYKIEVGLYEYPALTRVIVKDASGMTLGNRLILSETITVAQ